MKDYKNCDYGIINLGWKDKDITQVETRYCTSYNWWMAANEDVLQLEEELRIET